jgi:hypothetical protein
MKLTEFRFHVYPEDFNSGEVMVAEITMVIGNQKIGQRVILDGPPPYESVIDHLMRRATAQLKDAVKAADEAGELT